MKSKKLNQMMESIHLFWAFVGDLLKYRIILLVQQKNGISVMNMMDMDL